MPVFICPSCGSRESNIERRQQHQPRGCSSCGFGFLFELLEDYYPSPKTALITCDQQRRVLAVGGTTFAATGYREDDLIGHEVLQVLGVQDYEGDDPAERCLEWGVRVLDLECRYQPAGGGELKSATVDLFPAYDDDGGLLVALTPA